jgi:ethanolamine ammonia-lyase small subunit
VTRPEPADDTWSTLRRATPSRIGIGRVGAGVTTADLLDFQADHAMARDAVHAGLDVPLLRRRLAALGLGDPIEVPSRARDRAEYLRRPDLGRLPRELDRLPAGPFDVGFVVADGLSPHAVTEHAPPLIGLLAAELGPSAVLAPPVIATQARVAIGDPIGQRLGVGTVVVLIGERPGLTVSDSLGIYLTHRPEPGMLDAQRNCVSNVHGRGGLGHAEATRVVSGLVRAMALAGFSGIGLKDRSRPLDRRSPGADLRPPRPLP